MAKEIRTYRICGKPAQPGEPLVWVKIGRWVYYFHEKCIKEEAKK